VKCHICGNEFSHPPRKAHGVIDCCSQRCFDDAYGDSLPSPAPPSVVYNNPPVYDFPQAEQTEALIAKMPISCASCGASRPIRGQSYECGSYMSNGGVHIQSKNCRIRELEGRLGLAQTPPEPHG
jgi:hypothetical protein